MFRAIDAFRAETEDLLFPTTGEAFQKAFRVKDNVRGPYVKYASVKSKTSELALIRYDATGYTLESEHAVANGGALPYYEFGGKHVCADATSSLVTFFTRKGRRMKTIDELIAQECNRMNSFREQCALLAKAELAQGTPPYPRKPFAYRLERARASLNQYLARKRAWLRRAEGRLRKMELRPGADEAKAELASRISRARQDVADARLMPKPPRYRWRYVNLVTNKALTAVQPVRIPDFVPLPTLHRSIWCKGVDVKIDLSLEVSALGQTVVERLKVDRRILSAFPANILGDNVSRPVNPNLPPQPNLLLEVGVEEVSQTLKRMIPSSHERVSVPLFLLEIADIKNTLTSVRGHLETAAKLAERDFRRLAQAARFGLVPTYRGRRVASSALAELGAAPFDYLKLMSSADLNRKFGMLPGIRDVTNILQGLSKKGRWYGDCVRALKRRGKLTTDSWLIKRETREDSRDVMLEDLIQLPTTVVDGNMGVSDLNRRISQLVVRLENVDPSYRKVATLLTETTTEYRLTFKFSYDYYDALGHPLLDDEIKGRWMLDNLGINLNLGFAWDHLPYSFVVDWVADVGKYLESRASKRWIKAAVAPYCGLLTRKTTTTTRIIPAYYSVSADSGPGDLREKIGLSLEYGDRRTTFTQVDFCRQVLSVEQLKTLIEESGVSIETSAPSLWQAITWTELLASR
jgi:hypothetical protein